MPRVKTEAQDRAKLRAAEERKAKHAHMTLNNLATAHGLDEHDLAELYAIQCRLLHAIKNQHVNDAEYKQYKQQRYSGESPMEGDY